MQAYCRTGAAHRLPSTIFHHLVRTPCGRELGVAPDPETVAIFRTVAEQIQARKRCNRAQLTQYAFVLEQLPHPVCRHRHAKTVSSGWNKLAEKRHSISPRTKFCGRSPTVLYALTGIRRWPNSILKRGGYCPADGHSASIMVSKGTGRHCHQQRIVAPLYSPAGELVGAFRTRHYPLAIPSWTGARRQVPLAPVGSSCTAEWSPRVNRFTARLSVNFNARFFMDRSTNLQMPSAVDHHDVIMIPPHS